VFDQGSVLGGLGHSFSETFDAELLLGATYTTFEDEATAENPQGDSGDDTTFAVYLTVEKELRTGCVTAFIQRDVGGGGFGFARRGTALDVLWDTIIVPDRWFFSLAGEHLKRTPSMRTTAVTTAAMCRSSPGCAGSSPASWPWTTRTVIEGQIWKVVWTTVPRATPGSSGWCSLWTSTPSPAERGRNQRSASSAASGAAEGASDDPPLAASVRNMPLRWAPILPTAGRAGEPSTLGGPHPSSGNGRRRTPSGRGRGACPPGG
jgi:hypothetical protein